MAETTFAAPDRLIYRHRRQDLRAYRTADYHFYVLDWDSAGNPRPGPLLTWWEWDALGLERDPDWVSVDEDWRLPL